MLVGGWKPGRRYIRCVSAGQRPRERAEPSIGERLLFIHGRNDFSNAYNLKHANEGFASPCSIRVIGPLNSYYYMAHGHNYVVHLVLLGPPPAPRNDGMAGTHLLASSSLPSSLCETCCQSYNFAVSLWRLEGDHFPFPGGSSCQILFAFSAACLLTPLRLWSLSPGAQEFSDLRAASLGF